MNGRAMLAMVASSTTISCAIEINTNAQPSLTSGLVVGRSMLAVFSDMRDSFRCEIGRWIGG